MHCITKLSALAYLLDASKRENERFRGGGEQCGLTIRPGTFDRHIRLGADA